MRTTTTAAWASRWVEDDVRLARMDADVLDRLEAVEDYVCSRARQPFESRRSGPANTSRTSAASRR